MVNFLQSSQAASGSQDVLLSVKALRNIALFVAIVIGAGAMFDYIRLGDALPLSATIGRCVVAAIILLSAIAAHFGHRTVAFMLFSVVQIFAVYNASVVAGFGVYSPALLYGMIPVVLSLALFGYPRGLLLSIPVIGTWGIAVSYHLVQMEERSSAIRKMLGNDDLYGALAVPSPSSWLLSQIAVAVITIGVIRLYERQARQLISQEQQAHNNTAENLAKTQTFSAEREKFMGYLSHELRTPLAAMRNAISVVRHPKVNDAMRERSLNTLDGAITNLQSLLDDALDSFKYGSSDFVLHESEFEIAELLNTLESLYANLAQSRGLEFSVSTDAAEGQRVTGDVMRLQQMMSNLILNAVKFTPSGRIDVRISSSSARGDFWRFEVRDTGPGISRDAQNKLFKPFAQVGDGASGSAFKGTGLGLTIVSQLSGAMGGRVGLSSEPGAGSVFYFEVPLRPATKRPAALRSV